MIIWVLKKELIIFLQTPIVNEHMKIVCLYGVWLNAKLQQSRMVDQHGCKSIRNLRDQVERFGFSFKVEIEWLRTSDPYVSSTWIYGLLSKPSGTHSCGVPLFYSRNLVNEMLF